MRSLVIGDIHGNFKALEHVLELSKFDPSNDTLYTLGDYTDGYPETHKVLDLLDQIYKESRYDPIIGNHDLWLLQYLNYGYADELWLTQGGRIVYDYYKNSEDHQQKINHINFLQSATHNYYIDKHNNVFVHGGYYDQQDISTQSQENLVWDRDLTDVASYRNIECIFHGEKFIPKTVFIGHTCTLQWNTDKPIIRNNLVNLDTGAGYRGKLTIMDVDTKEYWQSNLAHTYYPDFKHGR